MLNRLKTIAAALVGRPTPLRPRFAVFIDGDGVSPKEAKRVLDLLASEGHIHILRAYGNYNGRAAEGWAKLIRNRGIVARHLPPLIPGKNATDIALAIDAIEVLLTHSIDTFVLIVSDADFTPLANRLREGGKRVLGYGSPSTPESLRRACTAFIDLRAPHLTVGHTGTPAALWSHLPSDAEALVVAALTELGWNDQPVALQTLGVHLARRNVGFDTRTYSRSTLTELLRDLPSVQLIDHNGRRHVARPKAGTG